MYYFAYGSNMFSARLNERVPSARKVTTGSLSAHRLCFHKVGRDGSAKADMFYTGDTSDVLYGVIYQINGEDKVHLDRAESLGHGYQQKELVLATELGELNAFSYYALKIAAKTLPPFDWYHALVVHGAKEHQLPLHYINEIAAHNTLEDDDLARAKKHWGLLRPND